MKIDQKCINVLRGLTAETISNANSGHTGSSVGAATILYSLFKDHLVFSTSQDPYINRDRLVLSAGHVCPLLYATEHLFGFSITQDDLKQYRKYGSKLPGHPRFGETPGIEVSTGPLGQGIANAVGLAIAQTMLSERFNVLDDPIFSSKIYAFAGDGCLMEGVALEAISLAGTLKLNNLILLYDKNNITIDGNLASTNTEDVKGKFESQGWNVISNINGNNYGAVTKAISKAKQNQTKPTIIVFNTTIGYGTKYAGLSKIHGMPLSSDEVLEYKKFLDVSGEPFFVPEDVYKHCQTTTLKNNEIEMNWRRKVNLYSKTNPELYKQLCQFLDNKPVDVEKIVGNKIKEKKISGRSANNIILNLLADKYPNIVGGTADVASSTKAFITEGGVFSQQNKRGRNIAFGVREHAMGAIANGISLFAGLKVFVSTFFSFSNYLIPALRMSAIMNQQVLYFLTHDSLMVGEDGETHQPVEQIGAIRQMPNVNVCRPCDVNELVACYNIAYNSTCPSCFVLSKHDLPEQKSSVENAMKGGYVLEKDPGKVAVVLYATGSEVDLAISVKKELNKQDVKVAVCSFPCLEEFERQSEQYKNSVLFKDAKAKIAIEASSDTIWYKYIGEKGKVINVSQFGKSGRGAEVYKKYGFSVANIKKEISKIYKI